MKKTPILLAGLIIALVAAGLYVWSNTRTTGGTAEDPGAVTTSSPGGVAITRPASKTPAAMPFPVTVSVAGPNPAPMGALMTVRVAATTTATVRLIDLYDGARLVGSATPSQGEQAASFQVPADDPGVHAFVGRAATDQGRSATSSPTAVTQYAPRGAAPLQVTALDRETQAQAAARLGAPWVKVDLPDGTELDPRSAAVLPTGTLLRLVPPAAPVSPLQSGISSLAGGSSAASGTAASGTSATAMPATGTSATGTPATGTPARGTSATGTRATGTPATATSATGTAATSIPATPTPAPSQPEPFSGPTDTDPGPAISVTQQGCTLTLSTTAQDRVAVLQSSATTGEFVVTGEVEIGNNMVISNLPAGEWLFEGQDGDGTSPPIAVQVPDSCDPAWQGSVSIRHGLLVLPVAAANVYLYAGVDNLPFVRIPEADNQFVHAPTTTTPIADQLPQLRGHRLVLEAWRQNGSTAIVIGRGELDLPAGWSMDDAVGLPSTLHLDPASGPSADGTVDAHWGKPVSLRTHTDSTVADHLGYQVLAEPLTPANHDLQPYGLLMSGDAGKVSSTGRTSFTLDWGKLPRAKAASGRARVFIRVVAFTSRNVMLPMASRVLMILLPPVKVPPGPIPLFAPAVAKVSVTWPHVPNPNVANCIEVTHVPWKGKLTTPGGTTLNDGRAYYMSQVYPKVGRYCAVVTQTGGDDDDSGSCDVPVFCQIVEGAEAAGEAAADFVEAIVDGAATIWDWVAAAYNGVVDFVEDAIANFNPFCLAADAVSSSLGHDCTNVAKIVSTAVVTAVLESYGLPAQLPTSADIADIAKGDLKELAVQYMQSLGIPCSELKADGDAVSAADGLADQLDPDETHHYGKNLDVCGDLAGLLVDTLKKQIVQQDEQNTASILGFPYLEVPGFTIKAEPAAQLQPVVVTVTLTGGHPKPNYACPFTVHFLTPDKNAKPLYRDTAGVITAASPHLATAVADQLNMKNVAAESKFAGLPIEVAVHFDSRCVENAKTRTLYGILEKPLP